MKRMIPTPRLVRRSGACIALAAMLAPASGQTPDPRLREVRYDPQAVVTVPVQRGVVTMVELGADEAISDVAAGLGGDCNLAEAAWCIAAQPGGRHLFVKPKSGATAPNNLAVVTNQRSHSLRFVVMEAGDKRSPVYRLRIVAPVPRTASVASQRQAEPPSAAAAALAALAVLPALPSPPDPKTVVAARLQARAQVMNTQYSVAEGAGSEDIVPVLVFDDGRFTYMRFPGNREVPAVFHVQGDGSETLVNARMEDDLLMVDRVSRRLVLRAGEAVVGLWNEAFDLEGVPPGDGTTVPGVQRVLKADVSGTAAPTDARKGATP
jgi:type IV secretion system protein VirB9